MNITTTLKISIDEIENGYLVEYHDTEGVIGPLYFSNPISVITYCEEIFVKWQSAGRRKEQLAVMRGEKLEE